VSGVNASQSASTPRINFSNSRFGLTRGREVAKLRMLFFAFFAALREIREVLNFAMVSLRHIFRLLENAPVCDA